MARLSLCTLLLPVVLALCSSASPLDDPQLKEFLKRDEAVSEPIAARSSDEFLGPLARRAATGYQPRHLRVFEEEAPTLRKRQSDVGAPPDFGASNPAPVRGALGAPFLSGSNVAIDKQNLDAIAGPPTDSGNVPNLKWSMSLGHTRLLKGGWVREQLVTDLPPSVDFAAAELRLSPNAYRELHWHRVAEWGYILGGSCRIAAIDENGKSYVADLHGPSNGTDADIYTFPTGVPHSIQALDDGVEILLVFADGNFESTGTTFMLSDWLTHTPLDVVAKNFGVNASTLLKIPAKFPYIFDSTVAPPQFGQGASTLPEDPAGTIPNPYVFSISKQEKQVAPGGGGWMKLQTASTNFPPSKQFATNLVYIEPNGMREMHWHTMDEWIYVIAGTGRATAFAGGSTSRTFDFSVGDTGVFPNSFGHYMQNTSPTEPMVYIEMWKSESFVDFSATQWLALMPPQVVADLLNITIAEVQTLKKEKQFIVA